MDLLFEGLAQSSLPNHLHIVTQRMRARQGGGCDERFLSIRCSLKRCQPLAIGSAHLWWPSLRLCEISFVHRRGGFANLVQISPKSRPVRLQGSHNPLNTYLERNSLSVSRSSQLNCHSLIISKRFRLAWEGRAPARCLDRARDLFYRREGFAIHQRFALSQSTALVAKIIAFVEDS